MSNNFKLGRTLPGESRKNRELELARLAARKRRKIRITFVVTLASIATLVLVIWLTISIISMINDAHTAQNTSETTLEPSVKIIDENTGNHISARAKTFIARLERDFSALGYSIDHVVLPFQKAREISIYLAGRNEHYIVSIDRSSATQAEDAERMIRFLDEQGITASRVDLRIEGKAYYK